MAAQYHTACCSTTQTCSASVRYPVLRRSGPLFEQPDLLPGNSQCIWHVRHRQSARRAFASRAGSVGKEWRSYERWASAHGALGGTATVPVRSAKQLVPCEGLHFSSGSGADRIRTVARAESALPNSQGPSSGSLPQASKPVSGLVKRVLAGLALGAVGACVIVQGGALYLAFMVLFVYQSSREYFGFVTSVGLREGSEPPPAWGTSLVTLCCMSLPVYTFMTGGKIAVALALASFVILSMIVTTTKQPKLSTFTSAIFGLLYCGYLPTYWMKLRMLAIPSINTALASQWPFLFGGLTHVTVGFIATFVSIACIVASDTGAYFVGKNFGRTPLTRISPKKTVEGALGGLLASIVCAAALRVAFNWPLSLPGALGLGVVVCLSSILGDLIESVMKRDAGMKDSGTLIPGHGGLLDRFDSYIFTGAVVYFYIKCLTLFGV